MKSGNTITRRDLLAGGSVMSASGIGFACAQMEVRAKEISLGDKAYRFEYGRYRNRPGETKVGFYGGDNHHNGPRQILSIRRTLKATGWRVMFTTDSRFLIPEFLDDADLLIVFRPYGEPWDGFSQDPVIETPPSPDPFITDELEAYLVDSVKKRGMAFLGLHCTGAGSGPRRVRLQALLGMNNDKVHDPLQPVLVHDFNEKHPITQGMKEFRLSLEEPFGGDLMDKAVPLYKLTSLDEKRTMVNGWCLDQGKGRIAMIRLGHYYETLRNPRVCELHWRASHWLLRRNIPKFVPDETWY